MEISKEMLKNYSDSFDKLEKNIVSMNAVTQNGVFKSGQNRQIFGDVPHQFSISIDQKGITHQANSGRCWLFAATNCMRYQVIKKYNLEDFELSQNFLLFYDKLEKANYFLESMIELIDEPLDGRIVSFLISSPEQDGGQWDMMSNLVKKYGIVPKNIMPETACSSATSEMSDYLTEKLRWATGKFRKLHKLGKSEQEIRKEKEVVMEDIYRILCICLGKPPITFNFEIKTKDDKYITDYDITPKEFYERHVGLDLNEYVSIINAPTEDKPFNRSYTVKHLGNVKEGNIVRYLNLEIDRLKELAFAQLKDGEPVWFGCDVGKSKIRESGIMDMNAYNFEALFSTSMELTKAERLELGHSQMTHAMVFQGANVDQSGKINRWRVENSWGKEIGEKGYFVMSDNWFDEYMYQIVVNKKYLTEEELARYNESPIQLEAWDPMGSLAVTD